MPDYKNGKIYRLICNKTGLVYYGSTVKELNTRLSGHEGRYRLHLKTGKRYISSFEIIQEGDYYIELVQLVPCESKKELETVERRYIESNTCINKFIPTRTHTERYDKEHKSVYNKHYREQNIVALKAKDKKYFEEHRKKKPEYRENERLRSKKRREKNKTVQFVISILNEILDTFTT